MDFEIFQLKYFDNFIQCVFRDGYKVELRLFWVCIKYSDYIIFMLFINMDSKEVNVESVFVYNGGKLVFDYLIIIF